MATEVGKALLQFGAKKLYDELTGRKYGDATESTMAIIDAVKASANRVISEVTDVILKEEYRKYTTAIDSWMSQLKAKLKSAAENHSGAEDDLKAFRHDLNNANNGVELVLDGLNSLLIQRDGNYNRGLLASVCDNHNERLANPHKGDEDLGWYLRALDVYMATQIYWQNAGTALKLLVLDNNKPAAERFVQGMRERIQQQIRNCYDKSHPIVRSFKVNHQDEVSTKRRYWIQRCDDGNYLHIEDDNTVRCAWRDTGNGSYKSQFLFTELLTQGNSTMESYAAQGAKYWYHTMSRAEPRVSVQCPGENWQLLRTNIKALEKTGDALIFTLGIELLSRNFRIYPVPGT